MCKTNAVRCDEGRSWDPFPDLCVWGEVDSSGFGNGIRYGWSENCETSAPDSGVTFRDGSEDDEPAEDDHTLTLA